MSKTLHQSAAELNEAVRNLMWEIVTALKIVQLLNYATKLLNKIIK